MPVPPTSEPESDFVCACEEQLSELNVVYSDLQLRSDSPCAEEPFYKEHEGKRYCVLHFPGDKSEFWDALRRKLNSKDLDFRGVWFPRCPPFNNIQFLANANFGGAYFNGEVDFEQAVFEGHADFSRATFNGAAYFSDVTFKSATFSGATFRRITLFIRTSLLMPLVSSIRSFWLGHHSFKPFSIKIQISTE